MEPSQRRTQNMKEIGFSSCAPAILLYNISVKWNEINKNSLETLCWMLEQELLSSPYLRFVNISSNSTFVYKIKLRIILKAVVMAVYIWTTWDRAIYRVLSSRPNFAAKCLDDVFEFQWMNFISSELNGLTHDSYLEPSLLKRARLAIAFLRLINNSSILIY